MSSSGSKVSPSSSRRGGARRVGGSADDPPSRGSRRRNAGKGGKGGNASRKWLIAGAGAVVVLGGAAAAWWFLGPGGAGDTAERIPAQVGSYEAGEPTEVLADREADSRALQERELFERGGEELSSQGIDFTLEEAELLDDCTGAVWGQRPEEALSGADCSQVARAGYVSEDYVGMVALFNLADAEASRELAAALEPEGGEGDGDGFLTLMDGGDALGDIGAGYSASEITVNGHYLMVTWAQDRSSADPEERDNLAPPLRTLATFDLAVYRRLLEHDGGDAEAEDGAAETEDEAAE